MTCPYCSSLLRTRVKLSWAVPVDIQLLGPHLEAYIKVKPVLHQLRLCHRFGKGIQSHLNRLPQELLEMVIEEALKSQRAIAAPYTKWSHPFRCYENRCEPLDHYDEEQLAELRTEFREELSNDLWLDFPGEELGDQLEEIVEESVCEWVTHSEYYNICEIRKDDWRELIAQRTPGPYCQVHGRRQFHFENLDQVLINDFGLTAFISQQRIKESLKPFVAHHEAVSGDGPVLTTLCYLTLPKRTCVDATGYEDGIGFEEEGVVEVESSLFDVVNPASLRITIEQKNRFFKAMRVLGLEPFMRDCQLPSVQRDHATPLQPPQLPPGQPWKSEYGKRLETIRDESAKRVKEFEKSSWPKLLMVADTEFRV